MKKIFKNKESFVAQLFNFGLAPIIGMGISVITVPITTRLLLPEEYGKASLFTLAMNFISLIATLGFDQSYIRFYNQEDISKERLLDNCLVMPFCFLTIIDLFIFLFRKKLSLFLFDQYEPISIFLLTVFLLFHIIEVYSLYSLRMELRGKTYSFLSIYKQVLTFAFLITLLYFYERTFRAIIYSSVFATVVSSLTAAILSKQFHFRRIQLDKKLIIEFAKYCLPIVPTGLIVWLSESFDKVALKNWSDYNQLGIYSAAFKIVSLYGIIKTVFSTVWTPMAYKWYSQNAPKEKYENVGSLLLSVLSIAFAVLAVFRYFIILFLGSAYRDAANIFIFLLFYPMLTTITNVTGQGCGFAKKTIYSFYSCVISCVVNLIGNFILVPRMGALGASIATAMSYIVYFLAGTFFSRLVWVKFDLKKYFINIILLLVLSINITFMKIALIDYILLVIIILYNCIIIYKTLKNHLKNSLVN